EGCAPLSSSSLFDFLLADSEKDSALFRVRLNELPGLNFRIDPYETDEGQNEFMSCVCILTPLVIAAWPAFSAAVVAAATSLGYAVVEETKKLDEPAARSKTVNHIDLEIPQSELVMDTLHRDQRISVGREGVTVTFARDARGKASLCVAGEGYSEAELRARGEELSRRVVQKYVYQRLMEELRVRQFVVVEEEIDASQAIRLKVRHWEN